jgi:D-sedoheptulose 7-phosphate isomerase
MNKRPKEAILSLKEVLDRFFESRQALFDSASDALSASLRAGGKILLFGNGGSAAEAQHFAAELVNGLSRRDGPPLAALALTTDSSCLTAVGNDRGFPGVFARQIEALGRAGDAALALTTSGGSPNIVEGLRAARSKGLVTVALTGEGGGAAARLADILLDVPSCSVPRIQEAHLVLLHLLAERLEAGI